jgi:hypothetical protein
MKGTAVQTGNKTLDDLPGNQFKVIELLKLLYVKQIVQNAGNLGERKI